MNRNAERLTEREHDVLVVGGGILGVMVAWDASLRGLDVALVEQGDFASSTSSNSLKIVHGGLRYLQSFDFARARESIRERTAWLRIAPHLVEPLPVLVGAHRGSLRRRPLLRVGSMLADLLAWDRNRGVAPERRLAPGEVLSRSECLARAPELQSPELTGGLLFHDAQMYSSERLVLEAVQAAVEEGAAAVNYARFVGPLWHGGRLRGGHVRDRLGDAELEVRARAVLNAAGASAGGVARLLTGREARAVQPQTLALNLVLEGRGHEVAFGLPTASDGAGDRQLFFVPWRDRTVVGTGHYPWDGGPLEAGGRDALEPYVARFREEVGRTWPHGPVTPDTVIGVHAGLLPKDPSAPSDAPAAASLLRRRRAVDHAVHGTPNAMTGISVKYTTARLLAEELTDMACRKLGVDGRTCATAVTPLPGARGPGPAALQDRAVEELGDVLPVPVIEHLVRTYGSGYERVVAHRRWMGDWNRTVTDGSPVLRAQLAQGAIEEMACHPSDLLDRRTEVGATGHGDERARSVAEKVLRRVEERMSPTAGGETGPAR